MPSVANKRLLQICIFHSEVITLCDGLYKWLFKAHFTHNALRSLFKHGDWDSIVKKHMHKSNMRKVRTQHSRAPKIYVLISLTVMFSLEQQIRAST